MLRRQETNMPIQNSIADDLGRTTSATKPGRNSAGLRACFAASLLIMAAAPCLAQGYQQSPGKPGLDDEQPGDGQQEPQQQQPPRYGFGTPAQPPQAAPQQQNFADELTDFGVPPQSTLQVRVGSETPTSIPGGHVITTNEVRQAIGSNLIFIDVWESPPHPTLPGAVLMPGAGHPGTFDDATQQRLWNALSQMTNRQADRPIVFFCTGSRCWESYNAALRAINMGFRTVLWYRGGLGAWQASGGQMTAGGNQPGNPSRQGRAGFGR
jgi:PQQ-dependent catabolism-associated CXXCW motif protein